MKKIYFFLLMVLAVGNIDAQTNITAGSTNFTQDFNSLPTTSGTWADNTTLTGWYARTDNTASITTLGVNTGSSTGAGLYSFGIAGTNALTERSLGYAPSNAFTGGSGSGKGYLGWRLKNTTSGTITSINVTWTGEQWRKENNASSHVISLSYQTSATPITALPTGALTPTTSTFTSPITGATTASVLDGNLGANRSANIMVNITGLTLLPGEEIMLRWEDLNDSGNDHLIVIDDVTINAVVASAGTPDIALSSPNPAVPAANILQGSLNNVIYRFDLAVTVASATLNGVTITTAGSYATTDVSNFKVWYSSDNIFNAASDVLLSTKTTSLAAGSQAFTPFTSQVIASGSTGFIFITTDISCTAAVDNTLSVNAITTSDISFVSGNKSGTAFAGGTQTIAAATPNNVTGFSASVGNNTSNLSFTLPAGCYNEVIIVASSGVANTGTPSGDGTSYTGNLSYGSGTALGNGFVVYKGSTSPQTVTGLTNGTQYFFKIFTRLGTVYSAGVEVSATPANVTVASDFFRSRATGDFNDINTWESSPDGTTYINATMVPTVAANTVAIRNSHTVAVTQNTNLDQVIIESGGILNNTAGIITINDEASTADDLLIQNGGILILAVSNGAPAGAGILRTTSGGILRVSAATVIQNVQSARFIYEHSSVLEFTLTSAFAASGQVYFQNVDAVTIPIFRTTSNISGTVGGANPTVINGVFEANGTVNFSGTGSKTFRNGIRGTGNVSQGTSGTFIISSAIAELSGTGTLLLGTSGLQIASTSTTSLITNKIIDGGTITVDGNFNTISNQVSGTANILINGTLTTANANGISTSGALAISGTKILGAASTIIYNSTSAQQFTSGFNYVNVTMENGGIRTLDGAITITGVLNLSNGIVVTTATNLLTLDVAASFINASALSFVNGPLARNTNAATSYTYPVGKSGLYKPFDVIPATAVGSSFTGEYFIPNININAPTCTPGRLEAYVNNERWNVVRNSGTDNAAIRLNYSQAASNGNWTNGTGPMPDPDNTKAITVATYLTASACWEVFPDVTTLLIGDVVAGQTATSARSVFGDFTFGYGPFVALPIKIDYIRGVKQGSNNNLNWKVTCVSSPTASMELERSSGTGTFTKIYGLTATAIRCLDAFTYTDTNPPAGTNFYRLKMTDADGKSAYSAIIAILNKEKGFAIVSLSPNPARFNPILSVASAVAGKMDVVITDASGKIVSRQMLSLIAGSNLIPVKVDHLATGVYQLTGSIAGGEINTIRFIKE